MSVPKSKRCEGELLVLTRANELYDYTIKICSNEKNFPKRYRWCLTSKIIDNTDDVVNYIVHSNAIYVNSKQKAKRRLEYQEIALELSYTLLNRIDRANRAFGIESDRLEYWTRQIMEVQRLLRGWIKKDKVRYSEYLD